MLGHSGLIPYIIAVSAPRLERLLMTRKVVPHRRKSSDKELINFTVSVASTRIHGAFCNCPLSMILVIVGGGVAGSISQ